MSYAFKGGVEYEKLKSYSGREVELIQQAMVEIREQEQAAIDKSKPK